MLGASDPPGMQLPPINGNNNNNPQQQKQPMLPRINNTTDQPPSSSSADADNSRQSAFLAQPGSGTTFSLPPMTQFDPSLDRRRQNLNNNNNSSSSLKSPPLRAEDAVARLKKNHSSSNNNSTEQQQQQQHNHSHSHSHSHHSHNHNHNHSHSHTHSHHSSRRHNSSRPFSQFSPTPPRTGKAEVVVNSSDVLEAAKMFPRRQLGTVVYTPQVNDHVLLPRMDGNENSLIQVRIARRFLDKTNNFAVSKRRLWGTEVYTDDSDVVAALYHGGYLADQDDNEDNSKTLASNGNSANGKTAAAGNNKKRGANSTAPKDEEEEDHSKDGDCIATILILPRLVKYRGSYRNGINSRSWLTRHDGVSFKIQKVDYISRGQAESIPALKKRRLEEWHQMRKQIFESYPAFTFDKSKLKQQGTTDSA